MPVVVGFDLGTTRSRVAVWNAEEDDVRVILDDRGSRSIATCVSFGDTRRSIGDFAQKHAVDNPRGTILNAKRLLGRTSFDSLVQSEIQRMQGVQFVTQSIKPQISVQFNGVERRVHPEEVVAMLFAHLKEIAQECLGAEVTDAVIAVPACFNNAQRMATKAAARIAGLNVLRIMSEPMAAAVALNIEHRRPTHEYNALIFDLGGGMLDVAVLTIDDGVFDMKALSGESDLGGEDLTARLVAFCVEDFEKRFPGKRLSAEPCAIARLRVECERAKQLLSSSETEYIIKLDALCGDICYSCLVTHSILEALIAADLSRMLGHINTCLKDSQLEKGDIEDIILIGGSSRILGLQKSIKEFFDGRELLHWSDVEECVAAGAAIQGAILSGVDSVKLADVVLLEAMPLTLGLETAGGVMSPLIRKHRPIPTRVSQTFTTYSDNAAVSVLQVFEGDAVCTKDNHLLGKFAIHGIPPAPRGVPQIEVTFAVDADGILDVTGIDRAGGGGRTRITIAPDWLQLSEDEQRSMATAWPQQLVIASVLEIQPRQDASMTLSCFSLSGAEFARIIRDPQDVGLGAALASQLEIPRWQLQIVLSPGRILGEADDTLPLADLFDSELPTSKK